jgi:hypothetical protein
MGCQQSSLKTLAVLPVRDATIRIRHSLACPLFSPFSAFRIPHSAFRPLLYTLCLVPRALRLYILRPTPSALCLTPYAFALRPTPYTLRPTPSALCLRLAPYALRLAPYALYL